MTNVQILRNTISGAYTNGIDLNCIVNDVQIADNTIIDPAKGVSEKEMKSAIYLRGSAQNLRILNNSFYTNQASPISCGIYDAAKNLGSCTQAGNRVLGTGAPNVPVYFASPARKGAEWK